MVQAMGLSCHFTGETEGDQRKTLVGIIRYLVRDSNP
jgi:hypothetical protein